MQADRWLRLTDYANKYRVSISTLRRRIKLGQLAHRMEEGKYLILDEQSEPSGYQEFLAPDPSIDAPFIAEAQAKLDQMRATAANAEPSPATSLDEPILASANKLLGELKRAYMDILQEKEEQIIQLKEEVSDLKTLVRVLEDNNERMKRQIGGPQPIRSHMV